MSQTPGVWVSSSAHVAPVLLVNVRKLIIGPNVVIGGGNIFRGLNLLQLDKSAVMGYFNWVTAARVFEPFTDPASFARLTVCESAAITNRHYFDCTGGVTLGRMTTVGGLRSTWLTHRVDLAESRQVSSGTRVGENCFIASNVKVGPGVVMADRVVVGMGSVVIGVLDKPDRLYAGAPARDVGPAKNAGYVGRAVGFINPG